MSVYEIMDETKSFHAATIQRLNEGQRTALVAHFLALPTRDRHLRFGTPLGATAVAAYVDRINFARDAVFGVHDDRLALVGAAHVAFADDVAEVGLSVLPAHRRQGVGSALVKRAIAHARQRFAPRFFMRFLRDNAPIMRIARKFGMNIAARGGDADAYLELQPKSAPPALGARETQQAEGARRETGSEHRESPNRAATTRLAVFIAIYTAIAGAVHFLFWPDAAAVVPDSSPAPTSIAAACNPPTLKGHPCTDQRP
jgi:GNAT superfamily N-acetyltransferase